MGAFSVIIILQTSRRFVSSSFLQPGPCVLVLLAELLQDELLGERARHAEPQELLQDQRLVLGGAHLPLVQVTALRILTIYLVVDIDIDND